MTRIALAQTNPTVGDLDGNARKMRGLFQEASGRGADIVVFPAGALSGAPLAGLGHNRDFCERGEKILRQLAGDFSGRAFFKEMFHSPVPPPADRKLSVRSSATPYRRGSPAGMWREGGRFAAEHGVWLAECNLVGGQDDAVFAGGSYVAGPDGTVTKAALFREDLLVFDLEFPAGSETRATDGAPYSGNGRGTEESRSETASRNGNHPEGIAELYDALVLAIRDYVDKNGLPGAAVSLSGGVDSAVVLALAVDAVGAGRVRTLTLPGPFTSKETLGDAKRMAENFGVPIQEISIVETYEAARRSLKTLLSEGRADPEDIAGQNIQARIRGICIMALANRFNHVVMNCSNKSEAMTGYGTLYGDMVGGFSPLKDVWKTDVWNLARHCNALAGRERIPDSVILRMPSAELRENQEDRHSIPDYPILDAILSRFVDQGIPYAKILAEGFDQATVDKCLRLYYNSAFKRQQAPPGPFVGGNVAGVQPIINRFRPH